MNEDFFSRLDRYMKYSGLNDNKLTVQASLSVGSLGKQRKGSRGLSSESIAKILHSCPGLNADWLLTGRGEMLVSDPVSVSAVRKLSKSPFDLNLDRQQIPLYEFEAVAGLIPIFEGHSNPVDYLSIPDLPRCDGAIHVRGDSMYPLLKSGDIVVYKQVSAPFDIIWGEMYLISFRYADEDYITVKFVKKVDGHPELIQLVSQNAHHAPMEIPHDAIRALALVKASVRFNTMG